MVGLSGADGSGKSSLASAIAEALPVPPIRVYLYGCVVCRNVPASVAEGFRDDRGRSGGTLRTARDRILHAAAIVHGFVDASSLAWNLRRSIRSAELRRRSDSVVLSDRSPLDGLAKHDPPVGSLLARFYLKLANRYDTIVWLDAPPDVLAARDPDHTEAELQRWRERFADWAPYLPNAVRVDAARPLPQVVDAVKPAVAVLLRTLRIDNVTSRC